MTKEELEIDHSAGAEKKERSNSIVV